MNMNTYAQLKTILKMRAIVTIGNEQILEVLAPFSQPTSPVRWENGWLVKHPASDQAHFLNIRTAKKILSQPGCTVTQSPPLNISDEELLAELNTN